MADKLPVITISREYAAYGRTIARMLSERLDIPYYDRDFVKKTAEVSGYAEEDIKKDGEELSTATKWMNTILNNAAPYTSSSDAIFNAQRKAILDLSKEPCIIVGRLAGHVLREEGIPSFDIFLHASEEKRIAHALELGEAEETEIKKYVEKVDKHRETYYQTYAHTSMGDSREYDVTLDVGELGLENCVNALVYLIKGLY